MRSAILLLVLKVVIVGACVAINCIKCEQLSNVFVLETSDSPSHEENHNINAEASALKAKSLNSNEDSNTQIITDDSAPAATTTTQFSVSNKNQKQPQKKPTAEYQQVSASNHADSSTTTYELEMSNLKNQVQNDEARRNQNNGSSSRKVDDNEAQFAPPAKPSTATRSTNNTSKPKPASTTTTNSYEYNDNSNSSAPKVQDRLLISISSEEEEQGYNQRPPKHTGGHPDESHSSSSSSYGNNNNPKRKPAITISIQDANINKQNGGNLGGHPAVIVRPSDDGQGIVIATVASTSNHNQQRPTNNNNHHVVTEAPYREPVNNPIQSVINQYLSTTRRPTVTGGNDYGGTNGGSSLGNQRPITSTLVEQPSRPVHQVSDERPQRPSNQVEGTDSSYESGLSRPTARPSSRPTTQDSYGQSDNNNNNYEPTSSNSRPINGNTNNNEEPVRYPLNEKNCGLVHETRIVGGEEADPGDFLWMAAIVKSKPKEGEVRPFCGGSLITRRHILTAAHCLEGLSPRDVLVRLGSYDFDDSTASSLSADYAIDQFRVPAQYSKKTHAADIAIMRLKTPLQLSDNYKTVCMPLPRRSYVGALGTVTGYGSQSQTFRRAAPKLRQVTVPIWENRKCSVVYKRNLTESFLCAGYEEGGKDACQGDSGGPLMTEGPNERMMIVGVVSHGIGCGSPGYPGVYTRTTTFLDWVEKNTKE